MNYARCCNYTAKPSPSAPTKPSAGPVDAFVWLWCGCLKRLDGSSWQLELKQKLKLALELEPVISLVYGRGLFAIQALAMALFGLHC